MLGNKILALSCGSKSDPKLQDFDSGQELQLLLDNEQNDAANKSELGVFSVVPSMFHSE